MLHSGSFIKVGVAQIESHLGDLDANLDRHLAFIDQARAQAIDLLLFPEMSLAGHSGGGQTLTIAMRRDDPRLAKLAKAAGPMVTAVGLIEEGPAAQFYNSTYVFRDGALTHIHRKVSLATYGTFDEGKHFANGRYVETFYITPDWRVCVLICNDYWNPALVYLAALHGATLLLAPASSGREALGSEFDNPASWSVALGFYSMAYGLPIVFANRVGTEPGLTFWGGSRVLNAFGHAVAKGGEGEEIVTAELDYEHVRKARYRLPSVRDSNLGLISREIRRLEQIVGVPDTVRSN